MGNLIPDPYRSDRVRREMTAERPRTCAPSGETSRPAVLIVGSDVSLREALREANHGHDVFEVLKKALMSRGYDVVISLCPEEAKRLLQERSFEKIYSDGTLLGGQAPTVGKPPIFQMQGLSDGTVRVQIDYAVPPPVALALLDVLVDNAPKDLPTFS